MKPLVELVVRLAEYANATGAAPINRVAGCWHVALDGPPSVEWWMNGHREPVTLAHCADVSVPPFHVYLEYNGWPWAMVAPFGGEMLGSSDTEDAVIAVIQKALDAAMAASLSTPKE